MRFQLLSVLAAAHVAFGCSVLAQETSILRQVTVTGEGEVSAAPDTAEFRAGVTDEARDAETAMRRVSEVTDRVIRGLQDMGLPESAYR
ncbi:MAG: SIMPL domain-containing protein, partial [Pseudomonadota bacterium]